MIVSGCDDTTLKIWDAKTAECIHTLKGRPFRHCYFFRFYLSFFCQVSTFLCVWDFSIVLFFLYLGCKVLFVFFIHSFF